ncbi:hypothetical protein [Demequina gelatinilytica]|uniref:hypothetical protein n=1 Tax=Demequina gelatinilytica TaxID=1638980 RepID=UPI000AF941C2|nr:hypothetical protein [Demequina gelatinilytica]
MTKEPTEFGSLVTIAGVRYVRVNSSGPGDCHWLSEVVVDGLRYHRWETMRERA